LIATKANRPAKAAGESFRTEATEKLAPTESASATPKPKTVPHQEKMSERQPLPTVKAAKAKPEPLVELPFPVPPILLTGDEPYVPPPGPGHKFAARERSLASVPIAPPPFTQSATLPESYGSGRITATARDPRTIYVHWDFTFEQQQRFNKISSEGAMTLRMRRESTDGEVIATFRLHPDSRHWFAHVPEPDRAYVAELGYWQRDGGWVRVGTSESIRTPVDRPGPVGGEEPRFARVPDIPTPQRERPGSEDPAGQAQPKHSYQIDATFLQTRETARNRLEHFSPESPPSVEYVTAPSRWTITQEQALGEMIADVVTRTDWFGSVELVELLRRKLQPEIKPPPGDLGALLPSSAEFLPSSIEAAEQLHSSQAMPVQAEQGQRSFWFNVNAELIIYGATEPDATVTIGGRPIRLRPDGSFSYRFALPDGEYKLPAAATSRDGDTRRADLRFSRATIYTGEVGKHPQDPSLKLPAPENTF